MTKLEERRILNNCIQTLDRCIKNKAKIQSKTRVLAMIDPNSMEEVKRYDKANIASNDIGCTYKYLAGVIGTERKCKGYLWRWVDIV